MLAGREAQPSACVIDSQSVKTTEREGVHGYDGSKKLNARKRHIRVDTGGLLMRLKVHAADIPDCDGARPLLAAAERALSLMQHVWADMGYPGKAIKWITERLGWTVEIVNHPRKWGRYPIDVDPEALPAFTLPRRRRVVERTVARGLLGVAAIAGRVRGQRNEPADHAELDSFLVSRWQGSVDSPADFVQRVTALRGECGKVFGHGGCRHGTRLP